MITTKQQQRKWGNYLQKQKRKIVICTVIVCLVGMIIRKDGKWWKENVRKILTRRKIGMKEKGTQGKWTFQFSWHYFYYYFTRLVSCLWRNPQIFSQIHSKILCKRKLMTSHNHGKTNDGSTHNVMTAYKNILAKTNTVFYFIGFGCKIQNCNLG